MRACVLIYDTHVPCLYLVIRNLINLNMFRQIKMWIFYMRHEFPDLFSFIILMFMSYLLTIAMSRMA